jgi:hypothetical protein
VQGLGRVFGDGVIVVRRFALLVEVPHAIELTLLPFVAEGRTATGRLAH